MIFLLLMMQAIPACNASSTNQTGGITTCSVNSVNEIPTIKPGEGYSITSQGAVSTTPIICKDGHRFGKADLPGPMISKCRAEILGITIHGWTGPFWNPAPGIIEPWTGRCMASTMWMKKWGGDGLYYSDPDFLSIGRPKKGARPCKG